jgi:hypothetical protein
MRSGMMN